MDLNTFTIDQLPFQTSDTLPEFCVRRKVDLGKVPDEKDNTNPVYYMDEIFAAGGEEPVPPTPPVPEGFVDFGLPSGTLWAKMNLGATEGSTPEDWYGNRYAWGETEPNKEEYSWNTYKYAEGSSDTLTKYNNIDGLHTLEPIDDAATQTSSLWRTPSFDEMAELLMHTSGRLNWITDYKDIQGLNGVLLSKAIIVSPAFKNIPLYSTMFRGEIPEDSWAEMSIMTLEEINATLRMDIRTVIFKDADMQVLADYGIDYGFVVKEVDESVQLFIPANDLGEIHHGSGEIEYTPQCALWTNTLYGGNYSDVEVIGADETYPMSSGLAERYKGLVVRPVMNK